MPSTLASRRWRNWLQQLASWPLEEEGCLGGHKWKQNVLELKSQWLEDQEAGGAGSQGPWGRQDSFLCGAICSRSTCSSSWGPPKESGQLTVSLELKVKTMGWRQTLMQGARGSRASPPDPASLKTALPFFLFFPVNTVSSLTYCSFPTQC